MKAPWRDLLPGALLIAAVLAVYGNALDGPFVMDDQASIVENTAIRRLWPLTAALNPPPADVTFFNRPFINLTMCVNYALGGLNPRGYRLLSLAFHLGAALALMGLARRAFASVGRGEPEALWLGFAAALLWAVHPLLTSAVNYLSQRSEVAAGFFLFLTLYGVHRAEPSGPGKGSDPAARPSRAWSAAALFACLLGMGSKESMAAAPILALAYDRVFLSPSWTELWRKRGDFYIVMALTWLWPLSRHMAYSQYRVDAGLPADEVGRYLMTQGWALARMLRLAFWPSPLIFYYGTRLAGGLADVWPHVLLTLALLAATGWASIRRPRIGFLGLFLFGVLAPSSSFLPITGQPIAEHRMYAPLAVLAALAVLALDRVAGVSRGGRRAAVFFGLVAAWALALGGATVHRNRVFRHDLDLWADTIRKRPENGRAHTEYVRLLRLAGRSEEGLAHLERAAAAGFWEPSDLIHLGGAWSAFGRLEESAACYREALRLKPDWVVVRNLLGNVLVKLGRPDEAREVLEEAVRRRPTYADANFNLANILFEQQRYAEALAHYRMALKGRPDVALNWFNLGVAHAALGQYADAERCVARALELDPALPNGSQTLRRIREESGRVR